ncbi:hypothetical protein [Soonwooa sp.]|uniref:hypothetical protein n=1 Tax=Soonwooa sp. TaxID=1938592 RepID=UPI002615C488|nr:hypothetical protein [Soonwooa sp.]
MKYFYILIFSFFHIIINAKENNAIENLHYQKKNTVNTISPIDFGAKGDGISDDSQAFLKAMQTASQSLSKSIYIPDGYIFNLANKTIDFNLNPNIILNFQGGQLLNAKLIGQQTKINAERIKIFENIVLSGSFISTSDYAYPEWFGVFPYNINVDLVDALQKLEPVFYDISLGVGDYYTKKGEYMVKGLKGTSMAKTRVIMETDRSNTYIFSLGKVGGILKERNYDYNYIKDVTLVMSTPGKVRLKGNRGLIVGAAHKPIIENVKIFLFGDKLQFSKQDLEQFLANPNKMKEANVGVEFNGDSEVTTINNLFTLSDVGILFSSFCDFVTVRDYMNWSGTYGLATVYYKSVALPSQNILFTGGQSWCQGLYGLYAENSTTYNSFANAKFENIRIEQLVSDIRKQNKLQGANIWIGENETISNLQFQNVMFAGVSNGLHIGNTTYGRVFLENIITWGDPKISKDFALDLNFKIPDASLLIFLKNVSLPPDVNSNFNNGKIIYNGYIQQNVHEEKNLFPDNLIMGQGISLKKASSQSDELTSTQQLNIPNNNKDFIALANSKLSELKKTNTTVKYSVEISATDIYDNFEFVLFSNGKIQITKDSKYFTLNNENRFEDKKFNLLQDKDSGIIFLYNRLGIDSKINVTATESK